MAMGVLSVKMSVELFFANISRFHFVVATKHLRRAWSGLR